MNKAKGDCGAIFIRNKNGLIINYCAFINNTSTTSLSTYGSTDAVYVTGNSNVLIINTNFSKCSYLNEQANYQFTHVNSIEKSDFIIKIQYCMFSIIDSTNSQLFAQEVNNIGSFDIEYSTFTHFTTNLNFDNSNRAIQPDFNHIFSELNIPLHILDCCFDNNEYIISSKIKDQSKKAKFMDIKNSNIIIENNDINKKCYYPEIIDQMIIQILKTKHPTTPTKEPTGGKNIDNKIILIICVAVGGVITIALVVVVIIIIKKMKANSLLLSNVNLENSQKEFSNECCN